MNVYDLANNLAKGLQECDEYKRYQAALSQIKGNEEKEKILTDLRMKQMEIQSMQMMGQEVPKEKMTELEGMSKVLVNHPTIGEFLEAEFYLGQMLGDVQNTIGEAVELWTPEVK